MVCAPFCKRPYDESRKKRWKVSFSAPKVASRSSRLPRALLWKWPHVSSELIAAQLWGIRPYKTYDAGSERTSSSELHAAPSGRRVWARMTNKDAFTENIKIAVQRFPLSSSNYKFLGVDIWFLACVKHFSAEFSVELLPWVFFFSLTCDIKMWTRHKHRCLLEAAGCLIVYFRSMERNDLAVSWLVVTFWYHSHAVVVIIRSHATTHFHPPSIKSQPLDKFQCTSASWTPSLPASMNSATTKPFITEDF